MPDVAILIVDDNIASQNALRSVLDLDTWRIRVVSRPAQALAELATAVWNLVIVNAALAEPNGPLFAILRDLAESELTVPPDRPGEPRRKRLSVLFLVSSPRATEVQSLLDRESLPYLQKPYHLHDLLEKVSELLAESGIVAEPLRGIGGLAKSRRRREARSSRDTRRGVMFASREDYQMTEEEMAEFERQEEDERKKRDKELKEIKERGHA